MNCNLSASKYGLDPASAETSFAVTVSSWPSNHRQVRGYFPSPRMLSYEGTLVMTHKRTKYRSGLLRPRMYGDVAVNEILNVQCCGHQLAV